MGRQQGVRLEGIICRFEMYGKIYMDLCNIPRSTCIARNVRKPMKSATVPVIALRIKAMSPIVASRETVIS